MQFKVLPSFVQNNNNFTKAAKRKSNEMSAFPTADFVGL